MERKPRLDTEELKRRLGAMHARFRADAPAKIAELRDLWLRVGDAAPADPVRAQLLLAAHTLVGSAPTLGCEALGVSAGKLETTLRAAFEHGGALTEEESETIGRLVNALGESLPSLP
jgi:HPt (histidine-containing phosphotransfer) domain-containing protein